MASAPPPPTKHDVEVNWEDQQRICAFGRLTNRSHELRAMIASKEVCIYSYIIFSYWLILNLVDFSLSLFPTKHKKKRLEDAEEAESEIVLADEDDPCELVLGECFVEMEHSEAEETLNEMISREKDAIGKHKEELNTIESAMKDLKAKLYGKFGTSINLEE